VTTKVWGEREGGKRPYTASRWRKESAFAPCQDTQTFLETFARLWEARRRSVGGEAGAPYAVSVTLTDLAGGGSVTPPLFAEARKRLAVSRALDAINDKYGTNTAHFASLMGAKEDVPVRIAFSQVPDVRLDVKGREGRLESKGLGAREESV